MAAQLWPRSAHTKQNSNFRHTFARGHASLFITNHIDNKNNNNYNNNNNNNIYSATAIAIYG